MKKFIAPWGLILMLLFITPTYGLIFSPVYPQPATTPLWFEDFNAPEPTQELPSGWTVENNGGYYELRNDSLYLHPSSNGSIAVYREFVPPSDGFILAACVVLPKNHTAQGFALRVHSVIGTQLEHNFGATPYQNSAGPVVVMEIKAQRDPYGVEYRTYGDSGGGSSSSALNPNYENIRYICFEAWEGTNVQIDWVKINSIDSPLTPNKPDLTVSLSASTSIIGFTVEIKGSLTYNNFPVPSIPVRLYYRPINESNYNPTDESNFLPIPANETYESIWNEIPSVITASDGSFSTKWMPPAIGNYIVKATSWHSRWESVNATVESSLSVIPYLGQVTFSVSSNSLLSGLSFNSNTRELSFVVSGPSGTNGTVDVHIAKSIIEDISTLKVYIDGKQVDYTVTSKDDSWIVHVTYEHSTHRLVAQLDSMSNTLNPTLSTPLIVAAIVGVIAVIFAGIFMRKRKTTSSS